MDRWEKIKAAQRMQDYIHQHIDEEMTLEDICAASMYSKWYALRIFKEMFHKTPFSYIRALRLTAAARRIKNPSDSSILDVAVDAGFGSHEGFTKAFYRYFGVNPSQYRYHLPMRYMYFDPSSILQQHLLCHTKEYIDMAENQRTVTVTIIEKPTCKLILKRGIKSANYFEYAAEMGCDKFEVLETIQNALDKVVYVDLPPCMITPGTSRAAAALEVPADFCGEVPEGFELVDLPAHLYMWFNGAPYEDESMFGAAHLEVDRAIEHYKPELYGYEFAQDAAPVFQYFASAVNGVRQMIPVRRLAK